MPHFDVALHRLDPARTLVVVVDVQERLAAAMPQEAYRSFLRNVDVLTSAAAALGVGVAVTEQYPKGLGSTVEPLRAKLAAVGATVDHKVTFSAADAAGVVGALNGRGVTAVVVVGMEAHVCVYQTVRDLRARGVIVHLASDAVISRKAHDCAAGVALCERAGAVVTTTETIVFDWLERAGTDLFREISKLVR